MTALSKQNDYLNAYQTLINELAKPDMDGETLDDALADLKSSICLNFDDEDEGDGDVMDGVELADPTLDEYEALGIALDSRKADLDEFQRDLAADSLKALLEYIEN